MHWLAEQLGIWDALALGEKMDMRQARYWQTYYEDKADREEKARKKARTEARARQNRGSVTRG